MDITQMVLKIVNEKVILYNKYMTYLKKLFILKRPWYSGCPEDCVLYKKNTI